MFAERPYTLRPPLVATLERWLLSPAALVLAVLLAFFLNAASLPLTDVDEGAFSEATREMLARGNLVSPTLEGEPRHDKPILIYWAQAATVSLFGESPLSFRLPSLLAATAWLLLVQAFCRRHLGATTGRVAALLLALSLLVGFVAKAAIADALLNLCLTATLLALYEHLCTVDPEKRQKTLQAVYLCAGLGFLTKGPVAVLIPLAVGLAAAPRATLRACLYGRGWAIFLAVVLPWHVLVYVDQGEAFFRGFYLKHNVDRYTTTFEGHGGHWWYYLLVLPLALLPFSGGLAATFGRLPGCFARAELDGRGRLLERFLWLWCGVVLALFSFSHTQLPHYALYGCTPLFILLAMHRERWAEARLAYLPALLFGLLLALLPTLIAEALPRVDAYSAGLLETLAGQLAGWPSGLLALPFACAVALCLWRSLPVWQGLLLCAFVQVALLQGVLLPAVLETTQGPVQRLAAVARAQAAPVVAWGVHLPSFSVARQAPTPVRLPQPGELALTRADRVDALAAALPAGRPTVLARDHFLVLVRVDPGVQP